MVEISSGIDGEEEMDDTDEPVVFTGLAG